MPREVWINITRYPDGGQHDDLGFDWPDLPSDDPRENLLTLAHWAGTRVTRVATEQDWPPGEYTWQVFEGPERSGEAYTLPILFDWPAMARVLL